MLSCKKTQVDTESKGAEQLSVSYGKQAYSYREICNFCLSQNSLNTQVLKHTKRGKYQNVLLTKIASHLWPLLNAPLTKLLIATPF